MPALHSEPRTPYRPPEPRRVQVLFIGLGASRISWYRVVLPAMYSGCDWIGVGGQPPKLSFDTGYVKGDTQMPRFEDYDCIVIQQPRGHGWFRLIGRLQERGIKVLYEIDDYAHGIRKAADHDFRSEFSRDELQKMELCMRRCDGLIVTTEYLRRKYLRFNPRIWVCPNGLDLGRYRLSRPTQRPTVNGKPSVTIMWSGATGHLKGLGPWLEVIDDVMQEHPHTRFCSIGYPFAAPFQKVYGARAVAIPFSFLETYPAAMTIGDIALAPAGTSGFYRGKSPLRALEAGALGIPVIAAPNLYGDVVIDGRTGFLAGTPTEARDYLERLVQDESLRLRLGEEARDHVTSTYDMQILVENWKRAIVDCLGWK